MDSQRLAKVASRAFALYFLVNFVTGLTYLPQEAVSFIHTLHGSNRGLSSNAPLENALDLASHISVVGSAMTLLRSCLYLWAAIVLYRFGPGIQRFFNGENTADAE